MNIKEMIQKDRPYVINYRDMPMELQTKSKELCFEYNQTRPTETDKRKKIIKDLFAESTDLTMIEPSFRCDYGFNIHSTGMAIINYNCSILDTSPVFLGDGIFIAPGVCLACAGHPLVPEQRASGMETSAPIHIEDNVWLGANVTVLGGVTIGSGSVIGAGSVVNKDIPSGVVAVGAPCKVLRKITDEDRISSTI
ncbi:nodulation protein L [Companilactobacillus tucceti DSM 20183]|uniref:Acetyltransferase n=1 Tax=Companilactobacillus tucceti DSM 20183 TaxID=1423811 RepID=A0A0R1J4A6_9LACO|nr:sugar O-acetyltransferase [Companilactobacillus tucceti]KRK63721.1 nodulation protein L [Companilactobacillus tucceti DSM 20183]